MCSALAPALTESRPRAGGVAPVLVVGHNAVQRHVASQALDGAGIETLQSGSAADALAILARRPVAAVIVDHSPPGGGGLELTKRIRRMDGHRLTPVIIVSSDDSTELQVEALRAGATDFMAKPVIFDEMVARVQAQLELSRTWAARVARLEARAATVGAIAVLAPHMNPTVAARMICHYVSAAHAGTGVAIHAWDDHEGTLTTLAAVGTPPSLDLDVDIIMRLRRGSGPWVHRPLNRRWFACAPLRRVRSSLGLLLIDGDDESPDEMLAAAGDYASTASLQLGPALSERHRAGWRRRAVEHIIASGAFEPVFQPVVDLRDGRIVGYEALTRMRDGSPVTQALGDADDAGMRPRLELALLAATLADAASLPAGVWVSVNLSPSVLLSRTEDLSELLRSAPADLVLELTEHERIEDYAAVRRVLAQLGREVRLSVDDAGSGYASLRHVVHLRPQYLKLDRGWVANVQHDETRRAMIAGMVAFCEHTSTDLIAEGIEVPPERAALQALGVDYGQGFLLGRPGPLNGLVRGDGVRP